MNKQRSLKATFIILTLLLAFSLVGCEISPTSSPTQSPSLAPVVTKEPTPLPTPIPVITPEPTQEPEPTPEVKGEQAQKALVVRVIDGDTIEIEGGRKVRYIGIDTPETVHPSQPVQCFGYEASQKNKELVEGKTVKLEKDVSEIDKYGRLLRYVWVGDVFVNEYLVRQGYAQAYTYPPDVKYQDLFLQAQTEARENNRGLWETCGYFGEPEAPMLTSSPTPTQPLPQATQPPQTQAPGGYSCNCSKTCPQMSSCEEAQYQLNVCGCKARDADKDGIACDADCQ